MASTFPRIGFTKRRATTAKQPMSPGFLKNIGFSFIGILKTLLMHMTYIARTPLPFILLRKYTMDKKNEKLVSITIFSNYRQVTGAFSITLSDIFLPIQISYQGQTNCCHPKFKFPKEFNI